MPLLLEAGTIAIEAKSDLRPELKSDRSIVTRADREIEALLSRALEDVAAGEYVIGEETVDTKGDDYLHAALRQKAYVIDPIDGTAPYSFRLPNWGVSLGYMEGGRLTEGAVYLPEFHEIVLSTAAGVEEGRWEAGMWRWRTLGPPEPLARDVGMIAITQSLAKRGKVNLPNPVQVLGCAVVPLVGLLQGRFSAYLGSVKLWDAAGALPLLLRLGFTASVRVGADVRRVGAEVEERTYVLTPGSADRWSFQSDLLVCRPEDEVRLRAAMVYG